MCGIKAQLEYVFRSIHNKPRVFSVYCLEIVLYEPLVE